MPGLSRVLVLVLVDLGPGGHAIAIGRRPLEANPSRRNARRLPSDLPGAPIPFGREILQLL